MRLFIVILALHGGFSDAEPTLLSDTEYVISCIKLTANYNATKACRGVKSDDEVAAVLSCVKQATSFNAIEACTGVKADSDVKAVIGCVARAVEYNAANACAGVH